jgi:hypothetical protein
MQVSQMKWHKSLAKNRMWDGRRAGKDIGLVGRLSVLGVSTASAHLLSRDYYGLNAIKFKMTLKERTNVFPFFKKKPRQRIFLKKNEKK